MTNIYKSYKEYLQDNPRNLWFKRKIYGWGWTPAKPQGWLTILIWLIVVVLAAMNPEQYSQFKIAIIVIATILLFYICYKKGEKPRWQWGLKK